MPKSTTLTASARLPLSMSMTLSGLTSRWTMPFSCAAPSAFATWRRIGMARAASMREAWRSTRPSDWPSRCSITKKTRPSASSPKSVTSQMYALPTFEAARASWRNHCNVSASRATSGRSSLSATFFSRSTCSDRYTLPMPPSPIFERMR